MEYNLASSPASKPKYVGLSEMIEWFVKYAPMVIAAIGLGDSGSSTITM